MEPKADWKTLGKVMNSSEGPLSGFTPTEKAAGKMTSPANTAIKVSMPAICSADLARSVRLLKYEA